MRRLHRVAAGLVLGLVIVTVVVWRMEASRSGPGAGETSLEQLGHYGRVPPFSLTDRSGRQVTRDDLRDHVSVIDFIYTECTETCPTQSLKMAQLERELADARDLRIASITVDPRHDTPKSSRATHSVTRRTTVGGSSPAISATSIAWRVTGSI